MRRFLHSRLLRCIICFCLICCIFVNCSPIRTKALLSESILVGAGIVIGSIMLGLGVGMEQLTNHLTKCIDVINSDYDFIDQDVLIHMYADYSVSIAHQTPTISNYVSSFAKDCHLTPVITPAVLSTMVLTLSLFV